MKSKDSQDGWLARVMRSEDLSAVLAIEQTAQPSPWARLSFEEALTNGYFTIVVEIDNKIEAYLVANMVMDELHLLNVVSSLKFRGCGLGHFLMSELFSYADKENLNRLFLEVRASNVIAQNLYEKWGFSQISIRKNYYRSNPNTGIREDAYIYFRELDSGPKAST